MAVTISATPALSSAPSSVSPLEVTRSCPTHAPSAGMRSGSSGVPPRGNAMTPPGYARWTTGSTPAPGASGLTSTWALSPMTSAPGTVAARVP